MYRPSDCPHITLRIDATPGFREDVIDGLGSLPRSLPARWFYDHRGSELFEMITGLDEYYVARAERCLLEKYASHIAKLAGRKRAVVEFGSGSSKKTPLILSAIDPCAYVPIDISGKFLRESTDELAHLFPSLSMFPIEADFTKSIDLPPELAGRPKLGFFPGSTIGNLEFTEAATLLKKMAAGLGEGSLLLIGIDRVKSTDILIPAYDDREGVTAEFNLNLLERINRELEGNLPIHCFKHVIRWNEKHKRIEMHLEATCDVDFRVAGHDFFIPTGDTIHTENSHKYSRSSADELLKAGDWQTISYWTDEEELFSLILARSIPSGD